MTFEAWLEAEVEAILDELLEEVIPELLEDFDRRVFGVVDAEPICAVSCGDWDSGDTVGYVVRGKHVPDAVIRARVAWDLGLARYEREELEAFRVRRCWGRLETWALAFPGEECEGMGDEEPEVWQWYDRPVAFGEAVTVLEMD